VRKVNNVDLAGLNDFFDTAQMNMKNTTPKLIEEIDKLRVENEQLRKLKFAADELLEARAFETEIWKARAAQLEDAIAAEREACARLAEECMEGNGSVVDDVLKDIAELIRERGIGWNA